jgi:intracellular septation protein
MAQLIEFSPLILFLLAFEFLGIYWATAALMFASVLVLVLHRLRTGVFKTMHIIIAVVAVTLGSATLLLHDARFIQWKPTVLMGLTAAAFLGSLVVGKEPLARRLLEGAFEEPLFISARAWRALNCLWALWFGSLAFANIYIVRHFSERTWVHFKVYGITATVVFMVPQVLYLSGKTKPAAVQG